MNNAIMTVVGVLMLFVAGVNYAMDVAEKNPQQIEMYLSKVRAQFAFAQSVSFYNPELLVVAIEEIYSVYGKDGSVSQINRMIEDGRLQPENYYLATWLSEERTIAQKRGHEGAIAIIDALIAAKQTDSNYAPKEERHGERDRKKNCIVQ